ncbi:lectin-like domain-containing protein [Reinekea sp.]|jgi:MSHA biogenesis protein MshQ|uniref:lectin-like domain-containing protein n=1 Tax=Reinekea sp. TaxID=1970455 RepID=UPI002A80AFDA|nr:hypothetical protein [Reinekea sp.]
MKRFKKIATALLLIFPALSLAATYTLPAVFGSGPFSNCGGLASLYSCSSSVTLPTGTIIDVTEPIALTISGSLVIGNSVQVNLANTDSLSLSATGNLTVGTNANIFAALSAGANITVAGNTNISGDLAAAANIVAGANTSIAGDVTANFLSVGSNSAVAGTCSPDNVACTATATPLPVGATCEYFDSATLPAGWTASSADRVGVSSQASSTGNSLFLRSGSATVDSPDFDLSLETEVELSVWVRRGQDLFSEDPDTGEDLLIQYKNASGAWVTLITYPGNGVNGQEYTPTFSLTGAQLHPNFAVRFWKIAGSIGDFDYWHIDDVCLTPLGPPTPTTCFTDNFSRASLGNDWAVTARGTGSRLPSIINNRLNITQNLRNQATAATLFRLFPSAGNKIVVEFDYYAYGNLTSGGDGLALVFSDSTVVPQPGGYGGSLGYAQKDALEGFAGGWMGIGLDEYGNFLNRNDGGKSGGFTSRVRETITIRGSGAGTSGYNYITSNGQIPTVLTLPSSLSPPISTATGHRYRVIIDHENGTNAYVTVERDTGSGFAMVVSQFDLLSQDNQDGIPGKMYLTLTGSTGGARNAHEIDNLEVCANFIEPAYTIDHYELIRDQDQGLTCEPLNITAKACLDTSCSSQVIGPVTTTFGPVAGWSGGNVKTNYTSGDSFQFQHTTAETIVLAVTESLPGLSPLSTFADTQCYVALARQSDCSVEFVDAAFRFFTTADPLSSVPAYNLTAALPLSNLLFRAIKSDESTGQCLPFLPNLSTVTSEIGTTCSNPSTCAVGQRVSWQQVLATPVNNPENNAGVANTTAVLVDFATNGTAEFSLTAPDMGLQTLTVTSAEFPDIDGADSGRTITGSVNLRVAPNSIRISDRETLIGSDLNPALAPNNTVMAGEDFRVKIQALDIAGDPVASFGRFDTDLSTAGIEHFEVNWTHSNAFPAQGTLAGTGSGVSNALSWSEEGNKLTTVLNYNEVSQITLTAAITDLWGDASPTSPSFVSPALEVAQFVASYLTAIPNSIATWGSGNAYQGKTDDISGLSFGIQAFPNSGPIPIQPILNYDNSSPLFPNDGANILQKKSADIGIGGNLTSTLTWATDSPPEPLHVDDDTVILSSSLTDIIWARKLSAPTIDDLNDLSALRLITGFELPSLSFSDSSGACLKTVATDACPTPAATLSFSTLDRPLFYVRLNIANQVNASDQEAFIPLSLEYLHNVIDLPPSAISAYDFQTLISEDSLTQTDLLGLANLGACTLTAKDSSDTTSETVLCNAVADSTAVPASTFDDPFANGTQKMLAGQGLFKATADRKVLGIVELQPNILDWMTWYWDGDINLSDSLDNDELSAPSSLVLFGEYQGRKPILFVRPRLR